MMNLGDALLAESTPGQSHRIHAEGVRVPLRRRLGKRQHILRDGRPAANERMRADAHKMMHRTQCPHLRPVFHDHMPTQSGGIRQENVIADAAVVRDMRVGHHQHVASDFGQPAALYRSPVDRNELPNLVVIADLQTSRLSCVTQILWGKADGRERKESVHGTDCRRPLYCYMREKLATFADLDIRTNNAIRTDLAAWMNLRGRINDGSGVNDHQTESGTFFGAFTMGADW